MYNVLLVDDEPFITEGLSDALDWSDFGLEVVGSAENGKQALELLRQVPTDILITDISMPVMDGLTLIREARELLPGLKVIILSGYNEFDYLKEGMRLGIENYLLKPVHFEELRATLRDTVDKLNAARPERAFGEDELGILRDNVMKRWLTGKIGAAELAERLEMLDIRLEKPYSAVAIVRCSGGGDEGCEKAEKLLADEEAVVLFKDAEEDDTIAIFGMDSPDEGRRMAEKKLLGLAEAGEGRLRISLGGGKPTEAAGESYEQARRAQQMFLIAPDRHYIDCNMLPSASDIALSEGLMEWEAYAKEFVSKDKTELLHRIAADFAAIRAVGVELMRAKGAAVELIIRMKLETDKLNRPDAAEAYRSALDRAVGADTMEALEEAVTAAATFSADSFAGEDMSPVIKQVLRHIETHYADSMTLKSLGQTYHIHPNYLGQLFHKQTGETFADYVNKYRIGKAKAMLLESPLKVNEIARQVGYWEIGYFYKQFKKHVGIVPSEYKGLL